MHKTNLGKGYIMTSRVFYHDYPDSPYIDAQYTIGNKIFHSRYRIIALGHYPENVKYTQKSSRSAVQLKMGPQLISKICNIAGFGNQLSLVIRKLANNL
ncbi:hypothetical protein RhiirC2_801668 [Rhizophagus irregularis]|uniref:Uncharacterized protein n=1 Tax=Rhizophagus irregularis TaxID=588596 RepID=A0A2N1M248_9GLOM|nr:hypothetical protein RhiirC2_801668 [Rhizophagus irregularis]